MYCMTEQNSNPQNAEWGKAGGVAALDRAFAILSAFNAGEESLSLAELATRTGLYKSTILRLLTALEHGEFIRRLSDGRYSIGPEPLRLAHIYQNSFRLNHVIQPILQELTKQTGETSSFYVRQHNNRVVLYRVEPARAVRFSIREGEQFPVDRGASGKILSAFTKPYKKGYEQIRDRLWAVSFGERDPETASASVAVLGVEQELHGALTLSGPRERFTNEHIFEACKLLLLSAAQASGALGGDPAIFAYSLEQLSSQSFLPV